MIIVADSSPITALLHLKHLYLLEELYGQIIIPLTVANELQSLAFFGFNLSFLEEKHKYVIQQASDVKLMEALRTYVDAGEAEAIALAKELNADWLLIDEKIGKHFAEAEHISCKGVIGILIEAKKQGLISLIKPLMDDLILNLKFRLSEKIYQLALKKADEDN